MRMLRLFFTLAFVLALAACSSSKFKTYHGPEVTEVQVYKSARRMALLHEGRVLKLYDIGLGFTPTGHKQFEGDGKTPEGAYFINAKNPNSNYHLSLMISYPNVADRDHAKLFDKSPGGEIFIHGGPRRPVRRRDWTDGCVAVTDKEIERIYAMVKVGTPIFIFP